MSQTEEVIGYALVSTVDGAFEVPHHCVFGFRTKAEAYEYAASLLAQAGLCQRCEAGFWIVGDRVSRQSGDVFGATDDEDNHFPDAQTLVEAAHDALSGTEYFHVFPIMKPAVPAVG